MLDKLVANLALIFLLNGDKLQGVPNDSVVLQCLRYLVSRTLFAKKLGKSSFILEMVSPIVTHMKLFVHISQFFEKQKVLFFTFKHLCIECETRSEIRSEVTTQGRSTTCQRLYVNSLIGVL